MSRYASIPQREMNGSGRASSSTHSSARAKMAIYTSNANSPSPAPAPGGSGGSASQKTRPYNQHQRAWSNGHSLPPPPTLNSGSASSSSSRSYGEKSFLTQSDTLLTKQQQTAKWTLPDGRAAIVGGNGDFDDEDEDFRRQKNDNRVTICSARGLLNTLTLAVVVFGLLALFAGYPIIDHFTRKQETTLGAFNIGGTNGTGQVPLILPTLQLIDQDTPASAQKWSSPYTNEDYHLVFSDEFNVPGRTFWPGDDPFWEAVDLWYGGTGDYEWYLPDMVNTTDGHLLITLENKPIHDLNFRSGMLQSWNKFCFQGGYIEFSAILPGTSREVGWWPGLWMQGNLARPGFLGTTDGMWPYSYDSCDSGILKNQTTSTSRGFDDVSTYEGSGKKGLNWLPGMRLPSCTCEGEDHPGPNVNTARSAPELDILEAQIRGKSVGQSSQSLQVAPFDMGYKWNQAPAKIYNEDTTEFNSYSGGVYQESGSAVTTLPNKVYAKDGNEFTTFAVEWVPDFKKDGTGSVTWYLDGTPTWTVTGASFPPRPELDIGQRYVPAEPMSIVMNLGLSRGFQSDLDFDTLTYPATMKIDHVRVYQPNSYKKNMISCDPPEYPTASYIKKHYEVYHNRDHTVWPSPVPKNRLTGC